MPSSHALCILVDLYACEECCWQLIQRPSPACTTVPSSCRYTCQLKSVEALGKWEAYYLVWMAVRCLDTYDCQWLQPTRPVYWIIEQFRSLRNCLNVHACHFGNDLICMTSQSTSSISWACLLLPGRFTQLRSKCSGQACWRRRFLGRWRGGQTIGIPPILSSSVYILILVA